MHEFSSPMEVTTLYRIASLPLLELLIATTLRNILTMVGQCSSRILQHYYGTWELISYIIDSLFYRYSFVQLQIFHYFLLYFSFLFYITSVYGLCRKQGFIWRIADYLVLMGYSICNVVYSFLWFVCRQIMSLKQFKWNSRAWGSRNPTMFLPLKFIWNPWIFNAEIRKVYGIRKWWYFETVTPLNIII